MTLIYYKLLIVRFCGSTTHQLSNMFLLFFTRDLQLSSGPWISWTWTGWASVLPWTQIWDIGHGSNVAIAVLKNCLCLCKIIIYVRHRKTTMKYQVWVLWSFDTLFTGGLAAKLPFSASHMATCRFQGHPHHSSESREGPGRCDGSWRSPTWRMW